MLKKLPADLEIISDISADSIREIDFFYPSDNLKVRGLLFLPEKQNPPFELIVFNHGGVKGIYEGIRIISRMLARDYSFAVFAPSYRGEDGSGGKIEIASGEVDDVLNGLYLLLKNNLFDKEKIYMVGSSHGALITLIAMANDSKGIIKKGVFGYGIADIFKWWKYLEDNELLDDLDVSGSLYPGTPDELPDYYHKRNGIEYISKIKFPLLIIHGDNDHIVPLEQAHILKNAADNAGIKNVTLEIIPDGWHGLLTERKTLPDGSFHLVKECANAWQIILDFLTGT
ncbi:MAG: alpha/beta fold hydrolase [bacterium]